MSEPEQVTAYRNPDTRSWAHSPYVIEHIDTLTAQLAEVTRERDEMRANYDGACRTIALMHFAATQHEAPNRGVVEDVQDLRTERDTLVRAIDEAMVNAHLGVFNAGDDPKTAINQLMVWAQDVGAYVADQERDTLAQIVERVREAVEKHGMSAAESCDFGDPYTTRVVRTKRILRALATREGA